jgi:hypothetical protein
VLGTFWIFLKKGAEKLVEYPGLFNCEVKSPKTIKAVWLLSLAGGITALVWIWAINPSIPGLP